MKYEITFYGTIIVEADDAEEAVSSATMYINENARDHCNIKEKEE